MKPIRGTLAVLLVGAAGLTTMGTAPVLAGAITSSTVMGSPNIITAYPPQIISASTNPRAIDAWGARTLVVGRVNTNVTTCQLKLLSHQSFAVTYATNVRRCHVNFYAYVTIAANPTPVYRSVAFELIGRNAWGQFTRGVFYINVAPKGSNFNPGPPPKVKIVDPPPPPPVIKKHSRPAPPAPPAPPVTVPGGGMGVSSTYSTNWSGYEVLGSGVTSVHGTFTVPALDNDETCTSEESQWVGVDGGVATGDNNLIQAGIMETPYDNSGYCEAPNYYYVQAWWEILPAYATPIYTISAHAGDVVTVSIWQDSPGSSYWTIKVVNDTNGESFQTDQYYTGTGQSAEWITESMTDQTDCSGQCTMTSYSPTVTYTKLGYNANTAPYEVDNVTMEQGYSDVSDASGVSTLGQLINQGFYTSYTGS